MGYSPNGDVQLTGEDLARARSFVEDAQEAVLKAREAFKQLGSVVKSQLGDSRVAMTAEIARVPRRRTTTAAVSRSLTTGPMDGASM
jgi:hypothetical protein